MIDIHEIRDNPDQFRQAIIDRGLDLDIDTLLAIDEKRRTLQQQTEELRQQQNNVNDEIAAASGNEKQEKIHAMKAIAANVKQHEQQLRKVEQEFQELMYQVPNIPDTSVPVDPTGKNNTTTKTVGDKPSFTFEPKDHIELAEHHKLVDFERGVKVAGARGYFITGKGVELVQGLQRMALDLAKERGFTLVDPPIIVREKFLFGTGHFPAHREEIFEARDKEKSHFLVGTSEVPLMGMYADEVLQEEQLPIKLAGVSPCFRTEVGSYGKDTQGLYRVRQFQKVEQLVLAENNVETSKAIFSELLQNAEDMLNALELPYRAVLKSTGDMGLGKVEEVDLEAWMPSRNNYGETHTCSRLHEFQARRLNIKYKDKDGKKHYVHTLNNTIIASPRILIPLLEIHQQEDGSVAIPSKLQEYVDPQLLKNNHA